MDDDRCPRCVYRRAFCLCADLAALGPVAPRTRVVIVRHYSERTRSSNSGRLAHLVMPDSVLHDVGGLDCGPDGPPLGDDTWLVFPDGAPRSAPPEPPPRTLVFLDATWRQARRMRQRLPYLRGLPTLSLAPVPAADRLRNAPAPGMVSTIEAIASALRLVEGSGPADLLERAFTIAVEHAHRAGRRPVPVSGEG